MPEDEWGTAVQNYTQLYGNVGDFSSQLKQLEAAVKEKPDDPARRFLLGFEYGYLNYPQQAVRELGKAVELEGRGMRPPGGCTISLPRRSALRWWARFPRPPHRPGPLLPALRRPPRRRPRRARLDFWRLAQLPLASPEARKCLWARFCLRTARGLTEPKAWTAAKEFLLVPLGLAQSWLLE